MSQSEAQHILPHPAPPAPPAPASLLRAVSLSVADQDLQCEFCTTQISYSNEYIRLGCRCILCYKCLVQYVRGKLGDRSLILRGLGVPCPFGEKCSAQLQTEVPKEGEDDEEVRRKEAATPYYLSPRHVEALYRYGERQFSNVASTGTGASIIDNANIDIGVDNLTILEYDKFWMWTMRPKCFCLSILRGERPVEAFTSPVPVAPVVITACGRLHSFDESEKGHSDISVQEGTVLQTEQLEESHRRTCLLSCGCSVHKECFLSFLRTKKHLVSAPEPDTQSDTAQVALAAAETETKSETETATETEVRAVTATCRASDYLRCPYSPVCDGLLAAADIMSLQDSCDDYSYTEIDIDADALSAELAVYSSMVRPPDKEDSTDLYIRATTKACPNPDCGFRSTHYHGHSCHHVREGCSNCKVHTTWFCCWLLSFSSQSLITIFQ